MYLLFLDASGNADFPPPYGHGKDTHYVLAGLAIHDSKWFDAYVGLKKICSQYFLVDVTRIEPHYSDLINGRGAWGKLSDVDRKGFADQVFKLMHDIHPTLFAMVIDKIKHFERYANPEHPKQLAVRFMVAHFSKFLQKRKEGGILIYDSEAMTTDRPLREFLTTGRLQGIVMQANWEKHPEALLQTQNRLEGIIETIFFVESRNSTGIQLADFCAYPIWSHFERDKDIRYNEISDLFDNDGQQNLGLCVWAPKRWKNDK